MFSQDLIDNARDVLGALRSRDLRLVTAESCTGGLISALLTEIPGSSDVVDRTYVTYSNVAKSEMVGVLPEIIERHGAVSAAVAIEMAKGALLRSHADLAIAVTGIAGPGGGTAQKPVGLVYMATARRDGEPSAHRFTYPDRGRQSIRLAALVEALRLIKEAA